MEEWLKRILYVMDLGRCVACESAQCFTLEDFRWLLQLSGEEVAEAEEALEELYRYGCIDRFAAEGNPTKYSSRV